MQGIEDDDDMGACNQVGQGQLVDCYVVTDDGGYGEGGQDISLRTYLSTAFRIPSVLLSFGRLHKYVKLYYRFHSTYVF